MNIKTNIFTGKAFVLTGLLQNIERFSITDFIESQGGRVTGSVSGKTDFLIAGQKLEDGRDANTSNKYKKAVKDGVKIFTEK